MDTATASTTEHTPTTIAGVVDPSVWNLRVETLRRALEDNSGCVSSLALRQLLEQKGVADARDVVVQLKFYDFTSAPDDGRPAPEFRWHMPAKSFYSEERFARFKQQQEAEVARVASNAVIVSQSAEATHDEPEPAPPSERRKIRQEQAWLGSYVALALENIYQSDLAPADAVYVFDVHKERPGSEFENVDVLPVHWWSDAHVELIAVEVKLDFTARLLEQVTNYSRFADRVWVAVPLTADEPDAAEFRAYDPLLVRRGPEHRARGACAHAPKNRRQPLTPAHPRALVARHRTPRENSSSNWYARALDTERSPHP